MLKPKDEKYVLDIFKRENFIKHLIFIKNIIQKKQESILITHQIIPFYFHVNISLFDSFGAVNMVILKMEKMQLHMLCLHMNNSR